MAVSLKGPLGQQSSLSADPWDAYSCHPGGEKRMETSRQDFAQERTRAALTLMPETFVRNWQMTGLRVLRAQERMLHGMMSAARLEMQFGQDLIMNRMGR